MTGISTRHWHLAAALVVALAPHVSAQTIFGTILGTVTDSSGARLQFQWTATNALNNPNWANPNMTLSNVANAGRITNVGGAGGRFDAPGPREMRLGLRVDW